MALVGDKDTAPLRPGHVARGSVRFPTGFLWGTSTAAHQVEGGNTNSDWWEWERRRGSPCREPSGTACEHYDRYADDVRLMASLGMTAYRFSVEWARVEPEPGTFDIAALDHYKKVVDTVLAFGLTPVVTLYHFSLPRWVARQGGWESCATPALLARYCSAAVKHLGERVDWYCTINEPGVVAAGGYLGAFGFPPGRRSVPAWKTAIRGLVEGIGASRTAVKEIRPDALVGATHSLSEWDVDRGGQGLVDFLRRMSEEVFLDASSEDDFVGVQTYTRVQVRLNRVLGGVVSAGLRLGPIVDAVVPWLARREATTRGAGVRPGSRVTQMGYEYRPEAVGTTLSEVAKRFPGKPIVVTEHGVATDDDAERIEFINRGLVSIADAMGAGAPVRGYFHWSAFDNFEWAMGYGPKFGVIAVDRATQVRTVKPSGRYLGGIARSGTVGRPPV